MRKVVASAAALSVVALVLTYATRRRHKQPDLYADVQWDPYPFYYASGS